MKTSNSQLHLLSILLLATSLLSIVACVKDPEIVNIEKIELLEQQDSFVLTKITSLVKNPNKVGAKISRINAQIFVEGLPLGYVDEVQNIQIKAKETKQVSLTSTVNLIQFSKLFPRIMAQDSSLVEVEGIYHLDVGPSTIKIKSNVKRNMPLRADVQRHIEQNLSEDAFDIDKIRLSGGGIFKSNWDMQFKIKNEFGIDYSIDSINLELFMPGQSKAFGYWVLEQPTQLEANSEKTINAKLVIDNSQAIRQLLLNFFGSSKQVKVVGNSYIQLNKYAFAIPIEQEVPIMSL